MALVPSSSYPTPLDALRAAVDGAQAIMVAVAFVTDSGVELLRGLVTTQARVSLEVVARGAPNHRA